MERLGENGPEPMKKKDAPRVSAVIPVYNGAAFLEESLVSLLSQTVELSEIIIIDDCSTDNPEKIVQAIAGQNKELIKVYCQSQTNGAAAARNLGCELAKGEWVLFMDADDYVEPSLLQWELDAVESYAGQWGVSPILAYSAYQSFNTLGDTLAGIYRSQPVRPGEILGYELVRNRISTSGLLVKRESFYQAGGFDTALKYSEDYDLWLRLAGLGDFAYVDEPLVKVRRHAGNTSKNLAKMLEGEKTVLKRYSPESIRQAIERRKLPWELNQTDFASVMYKTDRWDEGLEAVKRVCALKPDFAAGHFLYGIYFLHTGNREEAREAFIQTLKSDARHGAALNNLGALLMNDGKTHEAERFFLKALALYPEYLDAQHNLGVLKTEKQAEGREPRFTWRELRPVLTLY
jgi:glycosyltransferase involved in cell wall biosynthesis